MARRNFKNLRDDLAGRVGEERVAEAERVERDRYDLEQVRLADLRRARTLTQTQLAKALEVSQAQVSRIEGQSDLYLSTLASYIEAMGGELDLVATFSDDTKVAIAIGELVDVDVKAVPRSERVVRTPAKAAAGGRHVAHKKGAAKAAER